ncbi:MAG: hypothetical protein EXQ52_14875, partial [Bryobacterales bacterium]|nr:hypothetical protein [Bryobacterales bacterium]
MRISAGIIALCTTLGSYSGSQAATRCTDSDYSGAYAFSSIGTLVELPPEGRALLGTLLQAGRFLPDGKGGLFIETNASYNGIVINGDIPATYKVTPDCFINFDLVLPFPLSIPSKFVGVLSQNNRQMALLLTEPSGTVVKGDHYKQDLRFCGLKDFAGGYSVELHGTTNVPRNLAGRFQRIGRLVADGDGSFTATTIANYNGRVTPENITGTYTVSSKCYVTLNYTAPAAAGSEVIL